MELRRITSSSDSVLPELINLYIEAFPPEERRELPQLYTLIDTKKEMYFNVITEEEQTAGLFIYWDLRDFYYLEHLATFPEMRNRKIGRKLLEYVARHLPGERILEVEEEADELTSRRISYYKRNGYQVVKTDYTQWLYHKPEEALNMWIMSNVDYENRQILEEHIEQMVQKVYRDNYGL